LADAPATAAEPDWLIERRREGASLAEELALPGSKTKGWEFTDLTELEGERFEPGNPAVEVQSELDGSGARVGPLIEAASDGEFGDTVRRHFGTVVGRDDPFVARNEASWTGGTLVHVPRGEHLAEPVRIEVSAADGAASGARTLIVLEDDAEAEVWERWGGGGAGLFNSVVELRVGAGARLRYVVAQELSERSWVFASQRAEVERDATLDWTALGFGSARGKVRMETKLAGAGSSARVTGAYAGAGAQHLDYDTTQEHAAPHTTSDLAFRGVLAERATAVWRGMIRVDPGAQQTDAFQESRNLLLSPEAHADAIPGLEIEANDVRCTHAAAVAQIDRDQLYYLKTRGLDDETARRLIVEGFLEALVERLAEGEVRETVSAALERRLAEVLG
jgi:Fe-S cluster assembly protein SufD